MDVDALASIVGREHILGNVVTPGNADEVAAVLRYADQHGLAVAPRGGGTKASWGNPPTRVDLVLSLARLDQVVEHAWGDLTVTVEAGCPVAKLQDTLAQHGQRLAIDVLWPERATVGGILATNDSGAWRLRYGGLRDLVIGVTLALADGTLAASGGKVVKNVAGYDLPKLATGALGTLGVITQATFRLHPVPHTARSLILTPMDLDAAQQLLLTLQNSQLAHTALQLMVGHDTPPVLHLLLEGSAPGVAAQVDDAQRLASPALVAEAAAAVWREREGLWPTSGADASAVAKVSVLPARIAALVAAVRRCVPTENVPWRLVIQATGLGLLRIDMVGDALATAVRVLRSHVAAEGGSLVLLQQPPTATPIEAWGPPGDTLPLLRALKAQFDPHATLNPGGYVGGI